MASLSGLDLVRYAASVSVSMCLLSGYLSASPVRFLDLDRCSKKKSTIALLFLFPASYECEQMGRPLCHGVRKPIFRCRKKNEVEIDDRNPEVCFVNGVILNLFIFCKRTMTKGCWVFSFQSAGLDFFGEVKKENMEISKGCLHWRPVA